MEAIINLGQLCNREAVMTHRGTRLQEAAKMMMIHHVGSLMVVEQTPEGPVLCGILTDRDMVAALSREGFEAATATVGDVMTRNPVSCTVSDSEADALNLMRDHGIRRIPVTSAQGVVVGVISFDDLLALAANAMERFVQVIRHERSHEAEKTG